jgi:hypothetical protein
MKLFKVEVTADDGTASTHKVMASNIWHAIDLLYYKYGMEKVQQDRNKYKQAK